MGERSLLKRKKIKQILCQVKLRKKCVTTKFSKKTRQPEEILDEEKFLLHYCGSVIKSWGGLKYRYLEELLLVDVSAFDPNDALPYSQENAELLMKLSLIHI